MSKPDDVQTESCNPTMVATFFVNDLFFGIEVLDVQEILLRQDLTVVPLAPLPVEGLINLRGQIVTAIDMRRRLGLPLRAPEENVVNVVVRSKDGVASLVVDEIGDVLDVDDSMFEAAPENLTHVRELIRGVYKLEDRLLLAMDIERVLAIDTRTAPAAMQSRSAGDAIQAA